MPDKTVVAKKQGILYLVDCDKIANSVICVLFLGIQDMMILSKNIVKNLN